MISDLIQLRANAFNKQFQQTAFNKHDKEKKHTHSKRQRK